MKKPKQQKQKRRKARVWWVVVDAFNHMQHGAKRELWAAAFIIERPREKDLKIVKVREVILPKRGGKK